METDANMMAGPEAQRKTAWLTPVAKRFDHHRTMAWWFVDISLMMMG